MLSQSNIESRIESLVRFFSAFRAKSDSRDEERASLRDFLETFCRLRATLPARQPAPDEPKINAFQFEKFVHTFRSTFHDLRRSGGFINVWAVAGLKTNELRNAAVLAWLFDANQTHGFGSTILHAFLRQIHKHYNGIFPLPLNTLGAYSVSTECYPLGNVESRVDIVVDGQEFVAIIEVKIRAVEGDKQIERYLDLAKAKAKIRNSNAYCVIFLSPVRQPQPLENVIMATWNDIARSIEELVGDPSCLGDYVLLQFARHIRRF
jgi:hypothetical protein